MTIGRFVTPTLKLVRLLGQGGMGGVWEAENLTLRNFVAVKMMVRGYADDENSVAKFKEEAQRAARINNPHVTKVYDFGVAASGEPYIVMELLKGETLGKCIKRCGALPANEVAELIRQCAVGLAAAHKMGVVHRDIKPENLFIIDNAHRPFVMVLDFGIAKEMDVPPTKTQTGLMVGTPAYMSPEQFLDPRAVKERSDLWSLGIVAYEAFTGTRPFNGPTIYALATAITEAPFTAPSAIRPELPKALDGWMLKALAKKPTDRFASAMEMANELIKIIPSVPAMETYITLPAQESTYEELQTLVLPPLPKIPVITIPAPTVSDNRSPSSPSENIVRRGDMKPLRKRAPVLLVRTFDAAMVARIETGVRPQTAEDEWFVFTEKDRVYFHNANGSPVYEVVLEPTIAQGKRIAEAWVVPNNKGTLQNKFELARLFDKLFSDDPSQPPISVRTSLPPEQRIWVHEGDLATLGVDAIVNATDKKLLGGGGLDGDIHRAAGAGLLAECRKLGSCRTGEAKMTGGHSLPAKHVIHTVGPVWTGISKVEQTKLAACYANSLALAASAELRTIAFPSISTGRKRFPLDEAAFIAVRATLDFLSKNKSFIELVIFCTFTPEHTSAARRALANVINR
jgi:serine/threonine protein kinase/O-acetyl-ADP-ribose deacetylase (regulator of RNase III)